MQVIKNMTLREFIAENELNPEINNGQKLEWFKPDNTKFLYKKIFKCRVDIYVFENEKTGSLCSVEIGNIYTTLLDEDETHEILEYNV